jgi:hypothetical protein
MKTLAAREQAIFAYAQILSVNGNLVPGLTLNLVLRGSLLTYYTGLTGF